MEAEWVQGDMREFDLGRTFDLVVIAANSLLHLREAEDLIGCFRSVRRHLAPGARLVFDMFNPSFSTDSEADFVVAPLEIRNAALQIYVCEPD